ncbi:MAG: NHL repeat-containing protein [Planctomycetota bacterium]
MNTPEDLAFDPSGHLWIADTGNNQIRMINRGSGTVTVFGLPVDPGVLLRISGLPDGSGGFDGEGVPFGNPSRAYQGPSGIAIDSAGNLYIADTGNERIRVANATGSDITVANTLIAPGDIDTVVGNGLSGFSEGIARNSKLRSPKKITLDDSGNIFFADTNNHCIRAVDVGSGTLVVGTVVFNANEVGTLAGRGLNPGDDILGTEAKLSAPEGVALDHRSPRNVWIAESGSNRIRILNADPATQLDDVATDQGTTRSVTAGQVATIAGSAPAGIQVLDPKGLALDGPGIRIADSAQNQILALDLATRSLTVTAGTGTAGSTGDGGPATSGELDSPHGVAMDSGGILLAIADTGNGRIRGVNLSGSAVTAYGLTLDPGHIVTLATGLNGPLAIAIDTGGVAGSLDDIFVCDTRNHRIRRIARSDGTLTAVAGTGNGTYNAADEGFGIGDPSGIAILSTGQISISDEVNQRIYGFTVGGTIGTIVGTGVAGFNGDNLQALNTDLNSPGGLVPDPLGNLLIFDRSNHCIRRLAAGTLTIVCGTVDAGFNGDQRPGVNTRLNHPFSGAFDPSGNLYFSDTGNKRIRRFKP